MISISQMRKAEAQKRTIWLHSYGEGRAGIWAHVCHILSLVFFNVTFHPELDWVHLDEHGERSL